MEAVCRENAWNTLPISGSIYAEFVDLLVKGDTTWSVRDIHWFNIYKSSFSGVVH